MRKLIDTGSAVVFVVEGSAVPDYFACEVDDDESHGVTFYHQTVFTNQLTIASSILGTSHCSNLTGAVVVFLQDIFLKRVL